MRLTKLKIAGFKSFVDPTTVSFPSSLTGVVGPNGCGKSNIIDSVRWVMGEISAKHLRGDSMADVIFNGSSARKPLGTASVELVFDNSDGKIGGAYAAYNEVALRRSVSRDGSSDYYINGTKVRRKDITQLFLGTGLGSRSYAIIEQGMISRVIEARPDDLRAFLEEAAGISRYKERRRETESRISHTRENLDRLNDLREEVDKQIKHLQRQAATARRYQTLKEEERKLWAELLALRLQDLDLEAQIRDAAMAGCETTMQSGVADLREVEAHIERIRADQAGKADALNLIQARFYEAGSAVTRIEQSIQHAREMRQRQLADLQQVQSEVAELSSVMQRDRSHLDSLAQELAVMAPQLDTAHERESQAAQALAACEQALTEWQITWDAHARSVSAGQRETQVERARIEQLDSQQRRLLQQQERLAAERAALIEMQPTMATEALAERASAAEDAGRRASDELQELLAEMSAARDAEREQTQSLNALRARHQEAQGKLVSTEALQHAALGKASGKVTEWLKSKSLHMQPRVAQQLRVQKGWERAVETVLGSYLEAVCVDGLDGVAELLPSFHSGHLAVVSMQNDVALPAHSGGDASLLGKVQGTTVLSSVLAPVYTAESLQDALRMQPRLAAGESVVTRDGIWMGAEWLRVSRDADAHAGVIEREEVLREVRTQVGTLAEELRQLEQRLESTRDRVRDHEDRRDRLQAEVNRLHREHVDRKAEHDAAQSRRVDAQRRMAQLETELGDVAADLAGSEADSRAARARMETAIDALAALEPQRVGLEQSRERMRAELGAARIAASSAQQQARELALQVQSRRSSHSALTTTLSRIEMQLRGLESRQQEVAGQLAHGEEPLAASQMQLERSLQLRAEVEAELQAARIASDDLENHLREHDSRRQEAERRVEAARDALDEARLATQQVRVRRESFAEQLAATDFEFEALQSHMPDGAAVESWEAQLEDTRGKIERLGQVNLAAIGEYKEQSERKEYLDRQCKDLTDALETLESAMRKIDRETRARFQETFDRVNAGLKEKFPRLFGGGHAYLELTGEESTVAGVSVMARPPGKRNSTISQLSGGEKALTAVALVFAIFDLNPAPFCLLDEVDAPLDENNVGRFCDIVREMSRNVQFIFITHNKSTMELASQLIGVTMHEPGVSRLVAVDVDEAVRLAAM
jgi:chromosome segregation protein